MDMCIFSQQYHLTKLNFFEIVLAKKELATVC